MKDLLDLLDERITALLQKNDVLRQENTKLRQELTESAGILAEKNTALQEALAHEQAAKEIAANRIDSLLQRLTKHTSE